MRYEEQKIDQVRGRLEDGELQVETVFSKGVYNFKCVSCGCPKNVEEHYEIPFKYDQNSYCFPCAWHNTLYSNRGVRRIC